MINLRNSISQPLKGDELHFFHKNEYISKEINKLKQSLIDKVSGCHLIGGIRGCGKTSFANLCLDVLNKEKCKTLILEISILQTSNKEDIISHLIRALYVKSNQTQYESNKPITDTAIVKEIEKLYIRTFYNVTNKTNIKNSNNQLQTTNEKTQNRFNLGINNPIPYIRKLFKVSTQIQTENNLYVVDEISENISNNLEVAEIFDYNMRLLELTKIFSSLVKKGYTVILLFDELDKCPINTIELIFNNLKDILLNMGLISIFIVGYMEFLKYSSEDIIKNPLHTYFITKNYISTFDFNDTMKYAYRTFNVSDLLNAYKLFYFTDGIIRKINYYKYIQESSYWLDKNNINYYIYTKCISNLYNNFNIHEMDVIKPIIKEVITTLIENQKSNYEHTINLIQNKLSVININQKKSHFILDTILRSSKDIPNLIDIHYSNLNNLNDKTIIYNALSYDCLLEFATRLGSNKFECEEFKHLKNHTYNRINKNFNVIPKIPVLVAKNNNRGFPRLQRIIETTNYEIKNIVIITKKEISIVGIPYSGMVIVDRPCGLVNYIAEDCSFSREDSSYIRKYYEFIKCVNIKPIELKVDNIKLLDNLDNVYQEIIDIYE